jgi:N-carbamoylputrescine amidase
MKTATLALALQNAIPGQTRRNLENCIALTLEASQRGADLILFPEMNLTGYLSGPGIRPLAEAVPGDLTQTLAGIAREKGITILAGLAEAGVHDRVYATHFALPPDGSLHVYRKTHIAPPEREVFTPGDTVTVLETPLLRAGIQLCYDAHFPELSTAMALQGADILMMPHASPRGTPGEKYLSWMRHLTARAFDNGVFVAACNQVGDNGRGLRFPGIALVIGPDGNLVARHEDTGDSLFLVTLRKSLLDAVRGHRMRYFLPNRRGDLYQGITR